MYYTRFNEAFCEIILVGDREGLCHLHLNTEDGKRGFEIQEDWLRDDEFFAPVKREIREYFAGTRTAFEVKLNPRGTEFQKRVWRELSKIPYGEVVSYKDLAVRLGKESATRAVGAANGRNPISLIVPCHRVIGSDGRLTGYAHGLEMKKRLLAFEGRDFSLSSS